MAGQSSICFGYAWCRPPESRAATFINGLTPNSFHKKYRRSLFLRSRPVLPNHAIRRSRPASPAIRAAALHPGASPAATHNATAFLFSDTGADRAVLKLRTCATVTKVPEHAPPRMLRLPSVASARPAARGVDRFSLNNAPIRVAPSYRVASTRPPASPPVFGAACQDAATDEPGNLA